jgi:hypothetical protein
MYRGHKHFKEPEDSSMLVEVANAIAVGVKRSINWIHLPVPRNLTDGRHAELCVKTRHSKEEL